MSETVDIRKLIDSSPMAAETRAGKDVASKALDAISSAQAKGHQAFDLWATIDEQVGKAEAPELKQQLSKLRTRFEEEFLFAEINRIEKAFDEGSDAGWKAWLVTLAEAITHFRLRFANRLCQQAFPIQESNKQSLGNLRKAVRCMTQSRWPEAYEQLGFLSTQEFLAVATRAKLIAMLGQIQLFHYRKMDPARELFEAAERLAPVDSKVLSAFGEYWVAARDIQKARSYFERAATFEPGVSNAYTGMGEYFEGENQLDKAEQWYRKAIASAPGDSLGYSKLFKLYGRPELFIAHRDELQPILEKAVAVSEDEYQLYLDLGYVYEQNELFDDAERWYEKAIGLDETRPAGYVAIAQSYEKQGRKDEAEATYKQAIKVAPECSDAYFGLTWLYEQQEKWEDALEWYKKAPEDSKEWAAIARARVGEMYWRLQNYAEAEKTLKQELRSDPSNDTAKNALQAIADDYYKKRNYNDEARRVYGEILEILGDSYRGDYHNWLGNMSYFLGDYIQAANEYSSAIAASPGSAVFHRNLAVAYKQLKNYAEARSQLELGFGLDKDIKTFNKEMSLLLNTEANDHYALGDYRAAIERYAQAIEFDPSNDVIHSNLGGAWEHLKEPSRRVEALDNAIAALVSAGKLKSSEKYEADIERLRRKKEYALRYGEKAADWIHVVTPIAVEVAENLIPFTESSIGNSLSDELLKNLSDMKERIQNDFGVRIPGVRFRGNDTDLPPGSYIIMINEIPLVMGTIDVDQRFFPGAVEELAALGVEGTPASSPLRGDEGIWIGKTDWAKVEDAGLELWGVIEYCIRHLEVVVQRNLTEFVGHQEVANVVELESPERIAELRFSLGKLTALTAVSRGLLAEGAPIKPFAQIYETFERLYSEGVSAQDIVETIRSLPPLRPRLPGNDPRYGILRVGPRFEADIRHSIYKSGPHSLLAMEPESCQSTLAAVRSEVGLNDNVVVVVEDAHLRPFLRLLIELEFPNVPVLSRRELRTDVEFKTLGLVELEAETMLSTQDFSHRKNFAVSSNGQGDGQKEEMESSKIAITVFVNEAFIGKRASADDQSIEDLFSMMQDGLFYELGIVLPETRIEIDNNLKANEFRFNLNRREYPAFAGLESDEFLVNDTVERLIKLGIQATAAINPANLNECAIVKEEQASSKDCQEAGLSTWGPAGFLVLKLSAEIRKNAADFQTLSATQYIVDLLRTAFPDLVNTALTRFSVEQICLVLRNLLDEGISVRDLRSILESLLSISGTTDVDLSRFIVFTPRVQGLCPVLDNRTVENLTTADYSDFVRTDLKRYISHKYTRGSSTLIVYLLDPAIEKRLSNISMYPLTEEERATMKAAVNFEVGSLPPTAQNPVLLTTMDIRRTVRKLIEPDHPNLAVLSYQELSPDMNIQPIARISLS